MGKKRKKSKKSSRNTAVNILKKDEGNSSNHDLRSTLALLHDYMKAHLDEGTLINSEAYEKINQLLDKSRIEATDILQLLRTKVLQKYSFFYICNLETQKGKLIGDVQARKDILNQLFALLKILSKDQLLDILLETNTSKTNIVMFLAFLDPDLLSELFKLIQSKNLSLDSRNKLLKTLDDNCYNALMVAALYQPKSVGPILEAVKNLSEDNKAEILKQVNKYRVNALMLAALYQPESVVPILEAVKNLSEDNQAKILKQVSEYRVNALMLAARFQPKSVGPILEAVKNLSEDNKAEILKQVDKDGWNALMLAALYQPESVVPILEVVKTLSEGNQAKILKQVNKYRVNALMIAARHHPESVGRILEALSAADKAEILKQVGEDGWNALMLAVRYKPESVGPILEAVKNLSEGNKAEILKQVDKDGRNALMIDVRYKRESVGLILEVVKTLSAADQAEILKQVDKDGNNALMFVARYRTFFFLDRILKEVEILDLEAQIKLIKSSLSEEVIKRLPTSMYLGGFILEIIRAEKRFASCQFTASKAHYQTKIVKLKDFYQKCRALKNSSDSQEAWSLVFQQAKDDFEGDVDILKLISQYEREVNEKLCTQAMEMESARFTRFAANVNNSFKISETDSTYNACVKLFKTKNQFSESSCVSFYFSHNQDLNELFYFLSQLTPVDRHQILAEARKEFTIEASSDFDARYANYLFKKSSFPMPVIATPIKSDSSLGEDKAASAPPLMPVIATPIDNDNNTELLTIAQTAFHLESVVLSKNIACFWRVCNTEDKLSRQERHRLALILKRNPKQLRSLNLIHLGVTVDEIKDISQKDTCQQLLNILIDLSALYDQLSEEPLSKKLEFWSLWQDTTERFMGIVGKKSKAHPILLGLMQVMQQDRILGLQQQNRARLPQGSECVVEKTQEVSQTTSKTNTKKLWNMLENKEIIQVSLNDCIQSATPEELTYSENTQNILTLAIKYHPQCLANLVKKMSKQPLDTQQKIAELCNRSHIRLRNFLRLDGFSKDKDAQKALYLLELQRILQGLKGCGEYDTLNQLYNNLSVDQNNSYWIRNISDAQKELKKQSSVWSISALGRIGYGVGFFKPTLGHLLDEMILVANTKPAVR